MLGGLAGKIDQITGQPKSGGNGRYAEISEEDWESTYGDDLQTGTWRDLAEFVCDAQNEYNIGYGSANVSSTVGRWLMVLDDGNGNEVIGHARIKSRNSNDEGVETEVRSVHTRRLNVDSDTPSEQFAVPEEQSTKSIGEDSKFVLQFKLSSASAGTSVDFSADATVVAIPLTNYS